nr:hypothetical protein [Pseudonocardia acidicola]
MVSGVREIARSDATAREKLRNLADHLMEVYESHFPYPYVFIQENLKATWQEKSEWAERLTARVREVQSQVRGIVEHGIRDGEFRSDIPVELVVNGLFGMVNWSHRWFRPGQQHSGADVGRAFATLLLDGLGEAEHRLKPRD